MESVPPSARFLGGSVVRLAQLVRHFNAVTSRHWRDAGGMHSQSAGQARPLNGWGGVALVLVLSTCAAAMDVVTFERDGKQLEVVGRVLVEAQDGGLLVEARDGTYWAIPPEEQVEHETDARPFTHLPRDELAAKLLAGLPEGFDVHETAHYLILFDTSRAYAEWCGSLFERLYMAFTNYFSRKGFDIAEPEWPLVAVVFADRKDYLRHARGELGEAAESIVAYYSLRTNQMTLYDLTGLETAARHYGQQVTSRQVNRLLSQPGTMRQVSTIVHEATHQIAFNCGLHQRYSDCPRWFSEGIAMYFETPDLRSSRGWRGIGEVNRMRLSRFRQYLRRRPPDSLKTLVRDDARFLDTKQGLDAYAETWALTYFLIRQHPREYLEYLRRLSEKKPLLEDEPEQRLATFREVFGPLEPLDREFLRYMIRVR